MASQTDARAVVRPFRALHYDPARVDLAAVVAPPYDVIGPEQRRVLEERSPHNVVRLILPAPGAEEEAGAMLARWLDEGIVVDERRACLYWLQQEFTGPDGVQRTRSGAIAALRLTHYLDGPVRPHERTMDGPKAGRLALLRSVRANLSPVFCVYDDPEGAVAAAVAPEIAADVPMLEVSDDDGTVHRLFRICDPGVQEAVTETIGRSPITIADGHHRYETALAYRDERRAADGDPEGDRPYDFAPVYLAATSDPGLHIFPTHRVVRGVEPERWSAFEQLLAEHWHVTTVEGGIERLAERLEALDGGPQSLGIWRGAGRPGLLVRLRDGVDLERALPETSPAMRSLDVAAASALVLDDLLGLGAAEIRATDRLRYVRRPADAAAMVTEEPEQTALALLLRAPTVEDVEAVASEGDTMPQKSTFFFPKLLDGMVFHRLDARGGDDV